jgi:stage IV sporulation protein FB
MPVVNVMHVDVPAVGTDEPFEKAFRLMQENSSPALQVVDRLGRFVGLVTPENVGELMLVQSLQSRAGAPAWRAPARS